MTSPLVGHATCLRDLVLHAFLGLDLGIGSGQAVASPPSFCSLLQWVLAATTLPVVDPEETPQALSFTLFLTRHKG